MTGMGSPFGKVRHGLSLGRSHNKKKIQGDFMLKVPQPFFLKKRGCLRGVMVKAMDCRIVVSEFVLQSHYYVHFRANTLGKGMTPLIFPAIG